MGKNFAESYNTPDSTIEAVNQADLEATASVHRSQRVARSAGTQVIKSQVHPLLWAYLRQQGPLTESGMVDKAYLIFNRDYHVTAGSETIDSVTIYNSPQHKQSFEKTTP